MPTTSEIPLAFILLIAGASVFWLITFARLNLDEHGRMIRYSPDEIVAIMTAGRAELDRYPPTWRSFISTVVLFGLVCAYCFRGVRHRAAVMRDGAASTPRCGEGTRAGGAACSVAPLR